MIIWYGCTDTSNSFIFLYYSCVSSRYILPTFNCFTFIIMHEIHVAWPSTSIENIVVVSCPLLCHTASVLLPSTWHSVLSQGNCNIDAHCLQSYPLPTHRVYCVKLSCILQRALHGTFNKRWDVMIKNVYNDIRCILISMDNFSIYCYNNICF